MIKVNAYDSLGRGVFSWLDARYHFSFAEYYDSKRMGFGALRVINDDTVKAGGGFDTHPHRDMEIITYVRQGAITHRDSEGHQGTVQAGDVQVMSAGRGIYHSEFNLEDVDTRLYQIWIRPRTRGGVPQWKSRAFPKGYVDGQLALLVSGQEDEALTINQDAFIYGGRIREGGEVLQVISGQAYVLISQGRVLIDDVELEEGDGAEIVDESVMRIQAMTDVEMLVIDVFAVD